MRRVDLSDPPFTRDPDDPEGFRAGMYRFGKDLGARDTGTTLYELPPGQAVCPYHYEHGEEEWLLVLEGRVTVRTPEGDEELGPMQCAFFPKGPEGAHQVRNDGGEPARVLMWGTVVLPTVSVYPDSGKVGVWTEERRDDGLFRRADAVPYYEGEA